MTKTRPTLATVAEALGVSRMTVSNAFNRPDQLSPELREKVLATAQELGYSGPNPVARTLSRGRTGSIGVVIDASWA
jgi:DNA-binding LacI/PurR family transcriptional regulator